MKFLTVELSPLPILIPLGPKYSPQDPVFKYPTSCKCIDVGDTSATNSVSSLIFKQLGERKREWMLADLAQLYVYSFNESPRLVTCKLRLR